MVGNAFWTPPRPTSLSLSEEAIVVLCSTTICFDPAGFTMPSLLFDLIDALPDEPDNPNPAHNMSLPFGLPTATPLGD